jgi:hypothetical protein
MQSAATSECVIRQLVHGTSALSGGFYARFLPLPSIKGREQLAPPCAIPHQYFALIVAADSRLVAGTRQFPFFAAGNMAASGK